MSVSDPALARGLDRDRLTWLTYLMLGFLGCLLGGLGPILPSLRRELQLSYAAAGLHASMFGVGLIVAGLAGDRVIGRLGRRRTFWSAAIAAGVGGVVLALGRELPITLAGALVMGTAGSLLVVLVPAVLSDRHGDRRSTAIAEANSVASAMAALAPVIIGLAILVGWGWRVGLLIVPAVFLPLLVLRFAHLPFPAPGSPLVAVHREGPALPRRYWRHWLTLVLVVAVEFCVGLWASDYVGGVIGLPSAVAASAPTVFLVGMVAGRAGGGRLVLHRSSISLLPAALGLTGLGFALFWATRIPILVMAGLFVTGLGTAMLYPLALSLALATAPDATDTASARAALGSGVAILTAPLLLAWIGDQVGLRLAFLVVFGLLAGAFASQRARLGGPARSVPRQGPVVSTARDLGPAQPGTPGTSADPACLPPAP